MAKMYIPMNMSPLMNEAKAFLSSAEVFAFDRYAVLPGFCDVHVHFREPGFSYKETILSGSEAALHGGYSAVCTMPNLNPVPDCVESIRLQQEIINRDGKIAVYPYAAITVGQKGEKLVDFESLAPHCIAFSDDGKGVQDEGMMREAMTRAKALGKMIVAHCEVNDLLKGGYIHDGQYASSHGHRGICSESEWKQIERDIRLAQDTKCKYHVCHISTKESVRLIRDAKKSGVDITCETGPHYLVMDDSFLQEDGRFKMNPPLRDRSDREALVEGIVDGTIDMLATDHAPHSEEEKSKGLEKSAFGVVGLETAFSVLYTHLVKKGVITMEKLMEIMAINPRMRFDIPFDSLFSIWDLEEEYSVDPADFRSMGKATPFAGDRLFGKIIMTVKDSEVLSRY